MLWLLQEPEFGILIARTPRRRTAAARPFRGRDPFSWSAEFHCRRRSEPTIRWLATPPLKRPATAVAGSQRILQRELAQLILTATQPEISESPYGQF